LEKQKADFKNNMQGKKVYKTVKRGEDNGQEESKGEEVTREIEEYVRMIEKKTELFSTFEAEDIF